MSKTKYKILRRNADGSWDEFFEEGIAATSARGAIRAALEGPLGNGREEWEFNAIPMRSWKPTTVIIETRQRLRIG